jgi:hypothetical protein
VKIVDLRRDPYRDLRYANPRISGTNLGFSFLLTRLFSLLQWAQLTKPNHP